MKKIIIDILKFVGVSGIGWLIDVLIYLTLSSIIKLNVDISNMISSLVGVSFVFLVSTRKIFINNSKINLKLKYIIYIVYQLILIYLASLAILSLKNYLTSLDIKLVIKYVNIISKIIITPFTMLINFIVMKLLIEKI